MATAKNSITLDGNSLTLSDLELIAAGAPIKLARSARSRVTKCRRFVERQLKKGKPMYGINTGFGYLANTTIAAEDCQELQHNILCSHAAGHGEPLGEGETRLAMALRLNVLLKGNTGVRWELCEMLHSLLEAGIIPLVPDYGSVGASGDLAPLAHLALPVIGEGRVRYQGKVTSAAKALKAAGLQPLALAEKEGLSLINGTQVMLARGSLAAVEGWSLLLRAEKIAALSFEGMQGITSVLDPLIHEARGQKGQVDSAKNLLSELEGSPLLQSQGTNPRVQDPYSLRCTPQVHGPSRDSLTHALSIVERELNALTDNPLVFPEEGRIISGGNFHGQALAMAFDIATLAVAELANISERRLELLFNPHFSGLSAFLGAREGLDSGYMATQYLSASIVNENKILSHPACTDSIPGNVGVEDHVSMGMTSARKLRKVVENTYVCLAIEALAAAQAVDLRKLRKLGKGTRKTYKQLRAEVPMLDKDRVVHYDVDAAVRIMHSL